MKKRQKIKFCPRCGTTLNLVDSYCIRCGYSFRVKNKKLSFFQILTILIVLAVIWIGIRFFLNKPIIPTEIIDFVKGFVFGVTNKTG